MPEKRTLHSVSNFKASVPAYPTQKNNRASEGDREHSLKRDSVPAGGIMKPSFNPGLEYHLDNTTRIIKTHLSMNRENFSQNRESRWKKFVNFLLILEESSR